jgi:hypothetical protein
MQSNRKMQYNARRRVGVMCTEKFKEEAEKLKGKFNEEITDEKSKALYEFIEKLIEADPCLETEVEIKQSQKTIRAADEWITEIEEAITITKRRISKKTR